MRRGIRHLCRVSPVVLGIGFVAILGLNAHGRAMEQEIEALSSARAEAAARSLRLSELREIAEGLEHRVALLAGLRGGLNARQMFVVVDRAVGDEVWFRNWAFRREGEWIEPTEAVRPGYLVFAQRAGQAEHSEPERAWLMSSHMEISAQSSDHSALAEFARRLVVQPEVDEVRILNTEVHTDQDSIVESELAVVVQGGA